MVENKRKVLPGLRCLMGDRIYYISFMTFADIEALLCPAEEKRGVLVDEIVNSLIEDPEHFLSSIVIGVSEGSPTWHGIELDDLPAGLEIEDHSIGILSFDGSETLLIIDGHTRIMAIKRALSLEPNLAEDEIAVLFTSDSKNSFEQERRVNELTEILNRHKNLYWISSLAIARKKSEKGLL